MSQDFTRDFLGFLEEIEAQFLSWGYVDIGFSEQELLQLAVDWIEKEHCDVDPNVLIDSLFKKQMIQDFSIGKGSLFRTRMAETVRLLARLRQLFPGQNWREGATLVSDFRFSLRPRTYPRRDQKPNVVLDNISSLAEQTEIEILSRLLDRPQIKDFQLSQFQVRAIEQMLKDFSMKRDKGFIVCAGTGTGKTLSFYIPALTKIAKVTEEHEFWTKALALYPRNELLKDQFLETYEEARLLDIFMLETVGRKLRIGAYFGPAPSKPNIKSVKQAKWPYDKVKKAYECPYMTCPKCSSPLYWHEKDLAEEKERLLCSSHGCKKEIQKDEVLISRSSMEKEPPDVLFTTTEMMNRMMSNLQSCKLIGVGVAKPPFMMLLDEVHTYEGIHGAQVSYLLKRWRNAIKGSVHYTGLSATLEDAGMFFSQLVGLYPNDVTIIEPREEETIPEGKEYQLILRGDPVAGTSLLSTTIQTIMLLRRMLDIEDKHPSDGMVGERVFVFTDDLDVTNRLYHNVLDAEGFNHWGKPKNRQGYPLASIRSSSHPNPKERLKNGQNWKMAECIGHHLDEPLRIGRTSSQDTGVGAKLDVVVATASLEVGYNDPKVGAVIQHKAPMDMASFLQRKGRAGRKREMRPWTITVLSDYGRDRFVYQGFEQLFNPLLEKRVLPLQNRYVQRMQAVYCLIDWLASELKKKRITWYANLWSDLSGESTHPSQTERQEALIVILLDVVGNAKYRKRLEDFMKKSLRITDEELSDIFWEPPRSIMMAVIPTLLRRLQSQWQAYTLNGNKKEVKLGNTPLPEFIPASLFSDLSLPEVYINVGAEKPEVMRIVQALSTFAPGRVTRRFGISSGVDSHWVVPSNLELKDGHQVIRIDEFCKRGDEIGQFHYKEDGMEKHILCVRPFYLIPRQIPKEIMPTSNAHLLWKSELFPSKQHDSKQRVSGLKLDIPSGTWWDDLLVNIELFSHNSRNPVMVRRFATESVAEIKRKVNFVTEKFEKSFSFVNENGEKVALGFSQESDGILFTYYMPEGDLVSEKDQNSEKLQAYRTAYFRHRLMLDERLDGILNDFQRDRFCEIYLSVLTSIALKESCTLSKAYEVFSLGEFSTEVNSVLSVIFQSLGENDTMDEEEDASNRQRVHEDLLELSKNDMVMKVMHEIAPILWNRPDAEWKKWARERWRVTFASAILQACKEITNQFDNNGLIFDLLENSNGKEEIWITEETPGGGGLIEEVVLKYQEDPRRFFRLVESTLGPSDYELIDSELSRTLQLANESQEIRDAFSAFRQSSSYHEQVNAVQNIHTMLYEKGILVSHPVKSAIYNRILKPGSSDKTDELLSVLMTLWKTEEARLGINIDSRIFAFVFSTNESLHEKFNTALSHIDPSAIHDRKWRYQVIYSLLWPRGNQIRTRVLSVYHPFTKLEPTDREIVLDTILRESIISIADSDWKEKVQAALIANGVVKVKAELIDGEQVKQTLLDIASNPLEVGFLSLYPRIEGIERKGNHYYITLDMREVVQ